jgi:hypothetical protein
MVSTDPMHMMEIFKSVVLIDKSQSCKLVRDLKFKVMELEKKNEILEAELKTIADSQEIWYKDTYKFELKILNLEQENHELKKNMAAMILEKNDKI